MTRKTLTYDELRITPADVYEQMGYRDAVPDDMTQRETQAVINEVYTWLQPQFCYLVEAVLPPFDLGAIIRRQLRGAEAYALFICTSGTAFDAYQQHGAHVHCRRPWFCYCREVCRPYGGTFAGEH